MKRLFIESEGFRKKIDGLKNHNLLALIQSEILKDPASADRIMGTGGVQKIRIADPARHKGKRGGFRVIYLDLPAAQKTYLLWIYGKNEAEDISSHEKKEIKNLVLALKKEAIHEKN
jgi:hypothetical protein